MLSHVQLIARIAVGASLGGIIGYERHRHGRQVGLRTHLIVAMASATFMVVSNHFIFYQNYDFSVDHVEVDVSRIAASVVSGIGFLAGGAILKTGLSIQGLTTAAGLWLVTSIGLCAGAGMFWESAAVTLMGLLALTTLRRFEDKEDRFLNRHVRLELEQKGDLSSLIALVAQSGARLSQFDYKKNIGTHKLIVDFDIKLPASVKVETLIESLEKHPGILEIHIGKIV